MTHNNLVIDLRCFVHIILWSKSIFSKPLFRPLLNTSSTHLWRRHILLDIDILHVVLKACLTLLQCVLIVKKRNHNIAHFTYTSATLFEPSEHDLYDKSLRSNNVLDFSKCNLCTNTFIRWIHQVYVSAL